MNKVCNEIKVKIDLINEQTSVEQLKNLKKEIQQYINTGFEIIEINYQNT